MTRALVVLMLLALGLPAGALAARRLDRATAFRYAATAPLPRGGGVPSTPVRSLVVSSCRQRSPAFVCSVSVHYEPVPSGNPNVQTSAPQCDYSVRVAYASTRSRLPSARRVGAVTCPA